MYKAFGLGLLLVALIAGCATPKVKYGAFTQDKPRTDLASHADTYMLAKTLLTVSREESEDGAKETHRVALRVVEDPAISFGITPWNRMGVTTRVSLTKVANTQLVQSATISVEDKRIEFIGEAFKLLSTVTGVAVGAAPGAGVQPFPLNIDTLGLMNAGKCLRRKCTIKALQTATAPLNADLTVSEVPPDAIEVATVLGDLSAGGGVFFASACRQASLRVAIPGQDDLVSNFSLADPRYVQIVALPIKGQIVAHSECGYSVVPEEVTLQSDLKVADSFFDELLKFKKAYDESNSVDDKEEKDE